MAEGVDLNMASVVAAAADLGRIKERLFPVMKAVTARGALNIKNDARNRIQSQTEAKYVKQYPYSITYDITVASGTEIEAEIGPDQRKPQGPLGVVLEFPTPHSPAKPHLIPACDAEAPKYEEQMGIAAEKAVFGE